MTGSDAREIPLADNKRSGAKRQRAHALPNRKPADQIHVVRDGEEALDFLFCPGGFSEPRPAVAARLERLDPKLPKVNRLRVLQEVERDPRTRATPMIALTGSRKARDLRKNDQLGANRQIQETVSCSEFEAVVRQPGVRPLVNRKAAAATFLAQ
jgi:two-component system response regulator